jgi:hypothetical protein
VGGKSAGHVADEVGGGAGANKGSEGVDVERFVAHLPQRVPGAFFLPKVLCDGGPRDMESGRPYDGVKAGEGVSSSTALILQGIFEVLHILGMPVLPFGGDVGNYARSKKSHSLTT